MNLLPGVSLNEENQDLAVFVDDELRETWWLLGEKVLKLYHETEYPFEIKVFSLAEATDHFLRYLVSTEDPKASTVFEPRCLSDGLKQHMKLAIMHLDGSRIAFTERLAESLIQDGWDSASAWQAVRKALGVLDILLIIPAA